MKLDSRIIDGKKPLTCFDCEEAKQFIGHNGFFSDWATSFMDLNHLHRSKLVQIYRSENYAFQKAEIFADESGCSYEYFLPAEWINTMEPEKEWRPYSLTEWRHEYAIGDEIVFRIKDSDTVRAFMFCGLFSDHDDDLPGKGVISLGSELFVLQNLFDQFELRKNNEWQPFGVLDEDKE